MRFIFVYLYLKIFFEKSFWKNAVEKSFGEMLWRKILEKCFGEKFWRNALEKYLLKFFLIFFKNAY